MGEDIPDDWTPEETVYILTESDIEDRLADAYVDIREQDGDDDAATVTHIMHEHLTDEWYHEQATDG